jgi:hypothetical protein
MFAWIGKLFATFLSKPVKGFMPLTTADPQALVRALRPADVLLIEGNSRVATAIRYLTQSTWSHAALYVGPIEGRAEPDGEPHVMIEADVELGVISIPMSKYACAHTRICRPVGLSYSEAQKVTAFALRHLGNAYDLRNVFDLLRYFWPMPPVPSRFRRGMLALGAGDPTRAICSTLIAQAFQSVDYPILPSIEVIKNAVAGCGLESAGEERRQEILHIRHYSLFVPRDFDISPYFAIIKPTIEAGFDYHAVPWIGHRDAVPGEEATDPPRITAR